MQRAKFLRILLAVTVMAMVTVSWAPGWVWGKIGNQQSALDLANAEYPSLAKNESEKRILRVLDDISEGPVVEELHGRLLRILTESTRAKNVVEIGTGKGVSALWLCLGLRSTGGKLITHEIDYQNVLLATDNFKRAGVEHLVTVVQGDARRTIGQLKEPIDLLFIDAEGGNLEYLNSLLTLVRPGGLILVDNMSKPKPCPPFIKAITTNPNLETIFLNMHSTGITLIVKKI